MSTIAAFSKYLAYGIGGAEASTLALLKSEAGRGAHVKVISAANARFLGRALESTAVPTTWQCQEIEECIQLSRFTYLEYVLNRARVARWFSKLQADELWTYGSWAPAAMRGFQGPVRYFVRSETDLGIVGNYFQGWRRWAKALYALAESPATALYRHDLRRAAAGARVVANSAYMARRTLECLGVQAEVCYPPVDVEPIRARLSQAPMGEPKWIVFVGDNVYKGLNVTLDIARRAPDLSFRIFSRFVDRPRQDANIQWMPWQKEPWRVYEGARLVLIPSQWEEAYGRMAREAHLLGLPVLVSAIGGLPEAVDHQPSCQVQAYQNTEAWLDAIRRSLAEH